MFGDESSEFLLSELVMKDVAYVCAVLMTPEGPGGGLKGCLCNLLSHLL